MNLLFVGYLILTILLPSTAQSNCGTLVRSTCSDSITTEWNKKLIGQSLKGWMSSLTKITSILEREKEHIFIRKNIKVFELKANPRFEESGSMLSGFGVHYISNVECSTKKSTGPIWRKPSIYSANLLHDGFLYGIEDDNGEMTGCLMSFNFEIV